MDPRITESTKQNTKPMNVDDILKLIKPFGRYQLLIAIIYSYAYFPLDINNLFMGYGGIKPKWICMDQMDVRDRNHTLLPTDDCAIYDNCAKENLTFVTDFHSIVSEWSLVCDRAYLMNLITSIQMVGLLIGAMVIGPVTDLYGRKWTFFIVLCFEFGLGALSGLASSAHVFAIFRFVIGFCTGAEMVVGWVFSAETTTNRYRLLVRVVAAVFLPMWNQVFIAYITRHWKWYSIIGNLQGLPVLPFLAFFTYESPRWLAQKGQADEARHVLREMARMNKMSHMLPEKIELQTDWKDGAKRYHMWHLFSTKQLAIYTVISVCTWFAISLAHYGMFFDIGNLPTNVYLNGALLAGIGMLVVPMAMYDAYNPNVNRKYMLIGLFLVTALSNVAITLFETIAVGGSVSGVDTGNANTISGILISVSSIIGQVATEASFDVAYVYAIELFPTLLRSNANGLSSTGARLAGIVAPQLLYAGRHWTPIPYVVFAAISVLAAIFDGLFLPNTKNMDLPETYEQSNRQSIRDLRDLKDDTNKGRHTVTMNL